MTAEPTTRRRTGFLGNGPTYQDLLDVDSRPVPASMRRDEPGFFGSADVPVERYLSRAWHDREKASLWSRVWQFACREEVLAEVGDTQVYDIVDKSYLLVRTAPGPGGIKGFVNACLHRGRALRDGPGRVDELQCAFHGFCWSLSGKLKRVPSAWDFPQVRPETFALPEVRIGTWGGFVFLNPDPDAAPLAEFLGDLDSFFERWPLEDRYTRVHVSKVIRTNWKVAQEAFMESFHVITTHPQLLPGFGDANSQYDVFGNVSRAISPRGVPSPYLPWDPTEQERLNSQIDQRIDDPPMLEVEDGRTARQTLAEAARRSLRPVIGEGAEELSDAELVDSYFFTVFPNMHPWGGYNQITYRWRPHGDDHESCIMDVFLLSPFKGERPAPAAERRLGADEPWRTVVDDLGSLARVFDQDEFNLEAVQKGLKAMSKPGLSFGVYQESKIRHFHALYDAWLD
ncbi:MAG TPA: aromatic ring-hydroxylating dioxygenase subunit alpha [Mycobacteriales bacterium]|nr:aromatic ring-hydroxylating dioxygenase subunit alpha [Mycobacteriales bacterium]